MRPTPRIIVALAVAAATLVAIIWGWTREPAQASTATPERRAFEPSGGKRVTPERTPGMAASLASDFQQQLFESNPDLPGVESLQRDMAVVYESWLTADLSGFSELMIDKGATASPQTDAIVESRRTFYPDVPDEVWAAMTTEEGLGFLWRNPDERGGGWHRVDMGQARSGIGWHGAEQDLGKPAKGRYSVFEIENRKGVFGEAMRGERPTVWLVVPVEFNDGVWLETRLTWVWLDDSRGWYPARIETLGSQSRSCLMF